MKNWKAAIHTWEHYNKNDDYHAAEKKQSFECIQDFNIKPLNAK